MASKLRMLFSIITAILIMTPITVAAQGIPGAQYAPGPPQPGMYPPPTGPMPGPPLGGPMPGSAPMPGAPPMPGPGIPCGPSAVCPPMIMQECGPKNYTEPTIFFGYVYKDKGLGMKLESSDGNLGEIERIRQDFDINGLWLELQAPFTVTNCFGLSLGFGHMFPLKTKSVEGYLTTNTTTPADNREWTADPQWWTVDAAATYKLNCSLTAIGGFRWDTFMTNFKDPTLTAVVDTNGEERSDMTFNGYIPFLGLQLVRQVSCVSIVRATVIGTPIFWGDYDYKETIGSATAASRLHSSGVVNNGRFVEAMGEVAVNLCPMQVGAFVKFSALRGTDETDFVQQTDAQIASAPFKYEIDRRYWVFGARIGMTFDSPF